MGLIAGEADGLHRAVTDTLVAVFAIGFLQCQTVLHCLHTCFHFFFEK